MKRIIYQIDSFTKEKFSGNPAGVVINADGLSDEQMQLIARELNNSETSFLFTTDSNDHDGIIRYFTPTTEVPICGHATIAAMYARAMEEGLSDCILNYKTNIGILPFGIAKEAGRIRVTMTQGKYQHNNQSEDVRIKILSALGLEDFQLDRKLPIQISSTGNSKVIIPIKSKQILNHVTPNFNALISLSKEIDCNGYFLFTFDSGAKDVLTAGRMFAPAIGIQEDPVTGNAHGPLGGYLVQNKAIEVIDNRFTFRGLQGEVIERPGIVEVNVKIENGEPSLIQISGDAVIVYRTELDI